MNLIWVISDLHSGHKLALMNPETTLPAEDEEGNIVQNIVTLSSSQKYLWKQFDKNLQIVRKQAKKARSVIVLINGDLISGDKHPSGNLSTRISDQYRVAYYNLLPVMELPNLKMIRISMGTEAHNQGEGSGELAVGDMLTKAFPRINIKVVHHGLLSLDNLDIDYAHHGPHPGTRKWLEGNTLRYYLRDFMLKELLDGRVPARILVRAHYHAYRKEDVVIHTGKGDYTSTIILTPSWCMMSDYARQATRSTHLQTHGSVMIKSRKKRVEIISMIKKVDLRTRERG